MKGPLFMVGCGRTGSNLLEQILNSHSKIDLVPEMHFMTYWKKGLTDRLDGIGDLGRDENLRTAVELLYSEEPIGDYWTKIDIEKEKLYRKFSKSDRSYKDLIEIIMIEHARKKGKDHFGAKFPVHFSYLPKLFEWFPSARAVHMIRDPRAIFASELKKEEKPSFPFEKGNPFYPYEILIYVMIQWAWAARAHERYKEQFSERYRLCKFEDLIKDPKKTVKDICRFAREDFEDDMLDVVMRGSSFEDQKENGFRKEPLYRWKKTISPLQKNILDITLSKYMSRLSYL